MRFNLLHKSGRISTWSLWTYLVIHNLFGFALNIRFLMYFFFSYSFFAFEPVWGLLFRNAVKKQIQFSHTHRDWIVGSRRWQKKHGREKEKNDELHKKCFSLHCNRIIIIYSRICCGLSIPILELWNKFFFVCVSLHSVFCVSAFICVGRLNRQYNNFLLAKAVNSDIFIKSFYSFFLSTAFALHRNESE